MKSKWISICILLAMAAVARGDDQPDRVERIKKFREACEAERPKELANLQAAIVDCQKRVRAFERGKIDKTAPGIVEDMSIGAVRFNSKEQKAEQVAYQKKTLKEMQAKLEGVKNKSILTPPLLPFPLKLGAIGNLQRPKQRVFQVLSKNEALLDCAYSTPPHTRTEHFTVLLRGVDTSGMANNSATDLPQTFEVTGNYSYETALGESNTVLVIEPFKIEVSKSPGKASGPK